MSLMGFELRTSGVKVRALPTKPPKLPSDYIANAAEATGYALQQEWMELRWKQQQQQQKFLRRQTRRKKLSSASFFNFRPCLRRTRKKPVCWAPKTFEEKIFSADQHFVRFLTRVGSFFLVFVVVRLRWCQTNRYFLSSRNGGPVVCRAATEPRGSGFYSCQQQTFFRKYAQCQYTEKKKR